MSHSRRALLLFAVVALSSCSKQPVGPMHNIWRPLPGHVESLVVPAFRNGRQCWVYLPPGYSTSTQRYPVLYVNDGQWTFDQKAGMHVNRICEDLIRRGEMEPIIVVAIEEAGQRTFDYTPWQDSDAPTGGGDTYVRAVRDTLKPAIDRRYRTLPGREDTAIAGVSLGGFISVYAAFAYSTFGKVAALSPSYYRSEIYDAVQNSWPSRRGLVARFYQDTGYPDDYWIVLMEETAIRAGFLPGVDFMSVTVGGAGHSTPAWEHRFPGMLRFLFPPR